VAWGVGGVVAPVLGGVIITYLGWRYIFFVNVPIGLFAVFWARVAHTSSLLGYLEQPLERGYSVPLEGGVPISAKQRKTSGVTQK